MCDATLLPLEAKEDPALLGLDEGWKNWLETSPDTHATEKHQSNSLPQFPVKTELKKEEEGQVNLWVPNANSIRSTCQTFPDIKSNGIVGFETILTPGFSAVTVKEEPYDDVVAIFQESPLDVEKQIYHREIFWKVAEQVNKKLKTKELQTNYVDCLRKVADIKIFKCSLCKDYQSMHKDNVKSHLLLVHKLSDTNIKVFKCKTCNLERTRKDVMQKHILQHDDYSDDMMVNESGDDEPLVKLVKLNKNKVTKNQENLTKTCDLCSFESDCLDELKQHQKTHQSSNSIQKCAKFVCYMCPFENTSKIKLKKHLFEQHQIKTKNMEKVMKKWQCQQCDYNTDLKKSFEIHMLSHKDPEEIEYFYCANCDFKTKHKNYLRHHFLLKHKDPSEVVKKYMCEICSHRFRVRAKLKIHMLTHKTLSELNKVEKCTECNYQTKTKAALYTHMELHRAPKYVCDLCGHQSRRKWNHEMHLLTHKKDNDTEIFRCTVCSYKTKFKARFKLHQQRGNHFGTSSRKLRGTGGPQAMDQNFSDNLKFSCFVCQFETMHRKIFNEHSKIHENFEEVMKKRFVCDLCGFRAHHKTHLHTHSITHKTIDEVEPLKCEKCDFVTKSFHSLASHRQLHKEPKVVYTCDVCGLKNRRKYNHDVHLMTHKSSAEVPMIKCDLCSYQTKFKAYLREHLKKRHHIFTAKRPGRPHVSKSSRSELS